MTNTTTETEGCGQCGAIYSRFGYCLSCDKRTKCFDAAMDDEEYRATLHADDRRFVAMSTYLRDGAKGRERAAYRKAQKDIAAAALASGRWARSY